MKALSERFRIMLIVSVSTTITIGTIYAFSGSPHPDESINLKIKQDALLSQRIMLEKSLDDLKSDLFILQKKNTHLDNCIEKAKYQITVKEAQIRKLLAGNADSLTIAGQMNELEKIRKKLTLEVNSLDLELDKDLVQLGNKGHFDIQKY